MKYIFFIFLLLSFFTDTYASEYDKKAGEKLQAVIKILKILNKKIKSLSQDGRHLAPGRQKTDIENQVIVLKKYINSLKKKISVLEGSQFSVSDLEDLEDEMLEMKKAQRHFSNKMLIGANFNQKYENYALKIDTLDKNEYVVSNFSLLPSYRSDHLKVFSKIDFKYDSVNRRRTGVVVSEGFSTINFEKSELSVGKQKFLFGSSHFINPTNIFNPIDYYDILEQEQLPIWSLYYKYYFAKSWVGFIVAPVFEMSNVLDTKSRWIDFTGPVLDVLAPGSTLNYSVQDNFFPTEPSFSILYRVDLNNVNIGLFYSRAYDTVPTDIFQTISTPDVFNNEVSVVVKPYFDLKNYYGLDFQWSNDYFKFGVESLYSHSYSSTHPTDKDKLGDSTWVSVWGLEIPFKNYTFVFEYSGVQVVSKNGLSAQTRLLNNGVNENLVPSGLKNAYYDNFMPGLMYQVSDKMSFLLAGIFNNSDNSYVTKLQMNYQFLKSVNFDIAYDSFSGADSTSFWGVYKNNDRIMAHLKVSI